MNPWSKSKNLSVQDHGAALHGRSGNIPQRELVRGAALAVAEGGWDGGPEEGLEGELGRALAGSSYCGLTRASPAHR